MARAGNATLDGAVMGRREEKNAAAGVGKWRLRETGAKEKKRLGEARFSLLIT